MKKILKRKSGLFIITLIGVIGIFWSVSQIDAFSGPPGSPGEFYGGALKFDSDGNFGINTAPTSTVRLLIKTGGRAGLSIIDNDGVPIIFVTSTEVLIGNPTGHLLNGNFSLRTEGIIASSSRFGDLYVNRAKVYRSLIGEPGAIISGFQSISATTVSSTFSAGHVSPGVFPGGDYAFGEISSLGINMPDNSQNMATLHVSGTSYFSGNVGIKLIPPSGEEAALNISADANPWLASFNKGIRLENNSAIELGGGSGGTLYGIGASNNRLYIFNTNTEKNTGVPPNFFNLTLNESGVGVGIGATNPLATLHVSGTLRISGASGFIYQTSTAQTGRVLTLNSNGEATWTDPGAISGGSSGDTPRYDGSSWVASTLLYNDGNFIGVGTTSPSSDGRTLLRVGSGGYFQFDRTFSGAPTPGECTAQTTGRITLDTTSNFLYVCVNGSWKALKLIN